MTEAPPLLQVRNLKTHFHTRAGAVKAVDGVTFDIAAGEMVALVGESGCGKSASALSLLRLIPDPPGKIVAGEVLFEGRDLLTLTRRELRSVRGGRISMVFQEPMTSLNPLLTIGRQVSELLVEHQNMSWPDAKRESERLLTLVDISNADRRLEQYPDHLSGGMRQRVMIAMAIACRPRLLIADEPTTALDVTIQAQILELMCSLAQSSQLAVLLITHNLGVVARYASRVNVMYAGRIVEHGTVDQIFYRPQHPYTRALLKTIPRMDQGRVARLPTIEGQPPNLLHPPSGCAFHPRCSYARAACTEAWPPLVAEDGGHLVACPYRDAA